MDTRLDVFQEGARRIWGRSERAELTKAARTMLRDAGSEACLIEFDGGVIVFGNEEGVAAKLADRRTARYNS